MGERKAVVDVATDYENFMGRWSGAVGESFLPWLKAPPGSRWLDVGCGAGAFTRLVREHCSPRDVTGVDPAAGQIIYARARTPNVDWRVADATALPFADNAFDVVASALVLNFISDRTQALREMRRVLRPHGMLAGYLWERSETTDFSPHVPMERGLDGIGARILRPPAAPELTRDGLRAALERAGFSAVSVAAFDATLTFRDFEDYWGAQTSPIYPVGKSVAALDDARRAALRDAMRARLKPANDGSVAYSARALGFKALKPT